MSKEVNIEINRNDQAAKTASSTQSGEKDNTIGVNTLSEEDLYAREFELVLEGYMEFTQTYKAVSKQMMNPLKMRKNAGKIYEDLNRLSQKFNRIIHDFENRAVPPADLKEIHEKALTSLAHFEVYNNEFPDLMLSGDFKRINQLSKGLEAGHRGIKEIFEELEEREKQKS